MDNEKAIEKPTFSKVGVEAALKAKHLRKDIGGRQRDNGQSQDRSPQKPKGKKQSRKLAGEWSHREGGRVAVCDSYVIDKENWNILSKSIRPKLKEIRNIDSENILNKLEYNQKAKPLENKIKRIPVVDIDKNVVGVISMTDIAKSADKFEGEFFFN